MEERNRKEIDTCIRYKRSGDIMTIGTMEKIYRKQAKGMKEYIDQLRSMPVEQAKEISKSCAAALFPISHKNVWQTDGL